MSITKLVKDNNNDLAMFPYNLRQSGINPFICIYQKMTQINDTKKTLEIIIADIVFGRLTF